MVRGLWFLCGAVTLTGALLPLLGVPFFAGLAIMGLGIVGTFTVRRVAVSLGVDLGNAGGADGGDGGGDGGGGGK